MSNRDRADARMRAVRRGEDDFAAGKSRDASPYKGGSMWSLKPFWELGYDKAASIAKGEGKSDA